jgi:hypothetical protein
MLREALWDETHTILKLLELDPPDGDAMFLELGGANPCFLGYVVDLAACRKRPMQYKLPSCDVMEDANMHFVVNGQADEAQWQDKAEALFDEFVQGTMANCIIQGFLFHIATESFTSCAAGFRVSSSICLDMPLAKWSANVCTQSVSLLAELLCCKDEVEVSEMATAVEDILESDPSASVAGVLSMLPVVKQFVATETIVRASGLEELPEANGVTNKAVKVESVLKLLAAQSQVVLMLHGFAFVCNRLASDCVFADSDDGDNEIDSNIMEMLEEIGSRCSARPGLSAAVRFIEDEVLPVSFRADAADHVVRIISEAGIAKCKRELLDVALRVLAKEAEMMTQKTPRFQHIINKKYNGKLARSQLLESPNRDVLPGLVKALYSATKSVSNFMAVHGLGDATESTELEGAEGAIDMARLTLTVIAGVNLVEEFASAPNSRTMARAMLDEKVELPSALRDKIKKLAGI